MRHTDFFENLNEIDRRVFRTKAEFYAGEFKRRLSYELSASDSLEYFLSVINDQARLIERLKQRNTRFRKRIRVANQGDGKNRLLIEYSEELGATKRQLKHDRKALTRYLDAEALNDRVKKQIGDAERSLIYLLGRVSHLFNRLIDDQLMDSASAIEIWHDLNINEQLENLLFYQGDTRVKTAAVNALCGIARSVNTETQVQLLSADIKQMVFRFAQDSNQDVDLQNAALKTLCLYAITEFSEIAENRRLNSEKKQRSEDDFFVRATIANLICQNFTRLQKASHLLHYFAEDVSDFVRQETLRSLTLVPTEAAILQIKQSLKYEPVSQVRATALLALPSLVSTDISAAKNTKNSLIELYENEKDEFCLRSLLDTTSAIAAQMSQLNDQTLQTDWFTTFEPLISGLHINSTNLKVRRWAANAREFVWVHAGGPQRRDQFSELQNAVQHLPLSKQQKIRSQALNGLGKEDLGRILSVIAQEDFGLDVTPKTDSLKISRWYRFRFRFWRMIYEFRNSATDKRQGHKHMVGRVFYGTMSVPSNRLAEQTRTKVPGEPVNITAEDGPRNYLPLVDELISSLDQGWPTQPIEIYTSEGITAIYPPSGFIARLRARWRLIWLYSEFSKLRNWSDDAPHKPDTYLQEVSNLGFAFRLRGYTDPCGQAYPPHPSLAQFFPKSSIASVTLPSIALLWTDIKEYFFSIYSNSIMHLWIFLGGFCALFMGKHALINVQMNRARAAIPLSIGGWGTRGKSGTERLKAAVFNGLGLNVISKTTGCEAMFLEGNSHQNLNEMFLFRPYDKASIWEQVNLMKLARKLKADVFLWECMGLTPAYVHILQRHWMRDDIATITNTYPDHEDVQGPAGIDIPEVMTEFIPPKSTLITSEEIMYPILRNAADRLKTKSVPVTWREMGTVTDDIINRFPYEEHPNNIALVASMSEQLGIDRAFSLRTMADNVVLDLGVLKTYPASKVDDRTLQYIMGNSANERLGALGNWRRMGFDQHDIDKDPHIWVSTVVNNRADRVPRSKVFASLLVNDVSADQHVIIGTNVDGFEMFLHEAWQESFESFSIWQSLDPDEPDVKLAKQTCVTTAKRFRIPTKEQHISVRLEAMFAALSISLSNEDLTLLARGNTELCSKICVEHSIQQHELGIATQITHWHSELLEFTQFVADLPELDVEVANTRFINQIKQAFFRRVHHIYDPLISGDEIIQKIAELTPVGLTNRIMGMQNIKGTGLDFVYRWQAWERCHNACQRLHGDDEHVLTQALGELRAFEEFGLLSSNYVVQQLQIHQPSPMFQAKSAQADIVETILKIQSKSTDETTLSISESPSNKNKWFEITVAYIEQFIDLGDAVKRRKKADLIYQDLATYRISRAKAAIELQALTKRQKGGWLVKQL